MLVMLVLAGWPRGPWVGSLEYQDANLPTALTLSSSHMPQNILKGLPLGRDNIVVALARAVDIV